MGWNITGRAIEHCNCNSVCPCFTSALAQPGDYERCQGFIGVHIEAGTCDLGDLSGRSVIVVIDAPPAMAEGNWNVGVIVDDGATDDEAEFLADVVTGAAGGPMEAFGPLIGKRLGVIKAAVEIVSENGQHTIVAKDAIDGEFADLVHEGMEQPVQLVGAALPFGPPVTISPPTKSLINVFGLDIDSSGRHGTTSTVQWAG